MSKQSMGTQIGLFLFVVMQIIATNVNAQAGAQAGIDNKINQVEAQINQVLGNVAQPGTKIRAISETGFNGIYQVEIGSDVMYVFTQDDQVLLGQLFDSKNNINHSAEANRKRVGKLMSDLDTSQMIVFGPEDADRYINVFTDVDCGYCRKLHTEVSELNAAGLQVRYMAYPRSGIDSKTYHTMVSVWCSDDQKTALTEAKLGRYPEDATCSNPVSDQYSLGQQVGVTGTPTIITDSGEVIPGYMPSEALLTHLGIIQPE